MNFIEYPNSFIKNILELYGDRGKQWLDDLPTNLKSIVEQYQLTDLTPVSNMSFNYVALGHQHATPVVLKLGLDHNALARETQCLQAFAKHGAATVLTSDDGLIIMQQAVPGTTLKAYFPNDDIETVKILCGCLQRLHASELPNTQIFTELKKVLNVLDKQLNIPDRVLTKARQLRDHLLTSTNKAVLLHGDLHHDNILNNNNEWLVIDPKGFIGDPVFDACTFIYNPIPELLQNPQAETIINNRIQRCATLLKSSEQHLRDWCFVKIVLSWAWCLKDNIDPTYFKQLYNLLGSNKLNL